MPPDLPNAAPSLLFCANPDYKARMTLRRQLLLTISCLFALVFLGLQWLNLQATQDYLQQQLATHAQETATNLSRILAAPLNQADLTMATVEVQPVFDRGYFERIVIIDVHGKPLLTLQRPPSAQTTWLTDLLPLHSTPGEAFISAGWKQLGKVVVLIQPDHAYRYLQNQFWRSAGWLLVLYFVTLALTQLLLSFILRPLAEIERVAQAIQEKRFSQISLTPRTREFQRVILALNQMSARLATMLDEALAKAEKFRRQAMQDPVTGLQNRNSFDIRLQQLLQEEASFSQACLFVLEIDGLKTFNLQRGYQQGDQVLRKFAQTLASNLSDQEQFLTRLGGNTLATLLLDVSEVQHAELYCQQRQARLQSVASAYPELNLVFAAVCFNAQHRASDILAALDLALAKARHGETAKLCWQNLIENTGWTLGSTAWRELITTALREHRLHLYTQPVVELATGRILHYEIMARLQDSDGKLIPAYVFLPMALRHQLLPELDRAMLTLILQRMQSEAAQHHYAFNLSQQSLHDAAFCAWFKSSLLAHAPLVSRLYLELSEYRCAQNWPRLPNLLTEFRQLKLNYAIDHFVGQAHILSLIRNHPAAYLKFDAAYLVSLCANPESYSHWRSLQEIAQTLGTPIIVQNVENEAQARLLADEAIRYGQGYYYAAPSAKLKELSDDNTPLSRKTE